MTQLEVLSLAVSLDLLPAGVVHVPVACASVVFEPFSSIVGMSLTHPFQCFDCCTSGTAALDSTRTIRQVVRA